MLLRDSTRCNLYAQTVQRNNIYFKGLNKALSTRLLETNDEIDQLIVRYPNSNGAIGTLPQHWTMKMPQEKRGETFKSLIKDLGPIAETLRANSDKYKMKKDAVKIASKDFTTTLQNHGIIKKSAIDETEKKKTSLFDSLRNLLKSKERKVKELKPGELLTLGNGAFGRAFAFKDDENNTYVLKVFHTLLDEKFKERNSKIGHYKMMEPNRAAYIKKNTKSNEFAKFYFADLQKGFMITEYIDKRKKFKGKFSPHTIGVKYTDTKTSNLKNDSIIDYGGIQIVSKNIANNKTVKWVYNTLNKINSSEDRVTRWHQIFDEASNNKVPNSKDRLLGLLISTKLIPISKKEECLIQLKQLRDMNREFMKELDIFYQRNYFFKKETN